MFFVNVFVNSRRYSLALACAEHEEWEVLHFSSIHLKYFATLLASSLKPIMAQRHEATSIYFSHARHLKEKTSLHRGRRSATDSYRL